MQHKNTQTSSLLAIKKHVKSLPISLTQRSDLELVDIVNAQNPQSEAAKTIIIYRYLPKVLKDSNFPFFSSNKTKSVKVPPISIANLDIKFYFI